MDETAFIDAYCERIGPGLWAEPVNAVTNLAFILAAWVMWRRTQGLALGRALSVVLALIGLSSGMWHTYAVAWTGAADVLSILVFILIYLFAANRDFWGMRPSLAGMAMFPALAGMAAVGYLMTGIPFFAISSVYWGVALLIAGYAAALVRRDPGLARGLGIGAGILVLSITLRSVDELWCASFPLGTHFAWHLLNALMLGWMIEVWRRHRLAAAHAGR